MLENGVRVIPLGSRFFTGIQNDTQARLTYITAARVPENGEQMPENGEQRIESRGLGSFINTVKCF